MKLVYLPFALSGNSSDSKCSQECNKRKRSHHLEFFLGHRDDSHREVFRVLNIRHVEIAAEQDRILLNLLILLVLLLYFTEIVAHGTDLRVFNFSVIFVG